MTEKELDIIVNASIELSMKKVQKVIPQIKQQVTQAVSEVQKSMAAIDMTSISMKFQQSLHLAQRSIESLKESNKNNELAVAINNEDAQNQISQVEKEIDSIQKKTSQEPVEVNGLAKSTEGFKGKLEKAQKVIGALKTAFKPITQIAQKINGFVKGMGNSLKNGLGYAVKFVGTFVNLKSIYSLLSGAANTWLGSQNLVAQQLATNIEYMKYAIGSSFAPVIEYVTSLVYQLLKAIQSVVYAFSGVNIFAKSTAASMNKTAGNAKQTNKSLSGIHSEINNISTGNSNSGGGTMAPSIDMSGLDASMNPMAQKLYDFFKPLKESWDNYGGELISQLGDTARQVEGVIASVWGSLENIITNGTIYSILQNILAIIGNISEVFANAWNNNGNGDAIVQNLADALENLLISINNIIQSEEFQQWLSNCLEKFKDISDKLSNIDWNPMTEALRDVGTNIGDMALDVITGLIDVFKWIIEHPIVIEILLSLAAAIEIVSIAIGIWNVVQAVLNSELLASPITWIIAGIVALIAVIILVIANWESFSKAISDAWECLKEKIGEIVTAIGDFFNNLWQGIYNIFAGIGEWFGQKFTEAVEGIKNAFQGLKDFFSGVWQGICDVFSNVANWFGEKFSKAWEAVKNVFSTGGKIFDGIKDGILNGLKIVINAIIRGINKVVAIPFNGINTALKALRNLDLWGWKPFSWIGTINVPQIPELAKGNVAYSPLIARFGEYVGASTNPEITAPQNILRETFDEVLASHELKTRQTPSGELKQLVVQFGSTKVALEIERLLQQARRQNGIANVTI